MPTSGIISWRCDITSWTGGTIVLPPYAELRSLSDAESSPLANVVWNAPKAYKMLSPACFEQNSSLTAGENLTYRLEVENVAQETTVIPGDTAGPNLAPLTPFRVDALETLHLELSHDAGTSESVAFSLLVPFRQEGGS